MRVVPRKGSVHGILAVLDMVAENLKGLEIDTAKLHSSILVHPHESLEIGLFVDRMSFPMLTHLRLGRGSIVYSDIIVELINICPELRALDLDIDESFLEGPSEESEDHFRRTLILRKSRLEELRIVVRDEDHTDNYEPLLILLRHLTSVRRLSINMMTEFNPGVDEVIGIIGTYEHLEVLHLPTGTVKDDFPPSDKSLRFPKLKRLVLSGQDYVNLVSVNLPSAYRTTLTRLGIL